MCMMFNKICKLFSDLTNLLAVDEGVRGTTIIFHGVDINLYPEFKKLIFLNLKGNRLIELKDKLQTTLVDKVNLDMADAIEIVVSIMTRGLDTTEWDVVVENVTGGGF